MSTSSSDESTTERGLTPEPEESAPTPVPRTRHRPQPGALAPLVQPRQRPVPKPRTRVYGHCPVCLEPNRPLVKLSGCTHFVCNICTPLLPVRNCPCCRTPFTIQTSAARTTALTQQRRQVRSWFEHWCERTGLEPHAHQLSGLQWMVSVETGTGQNQLTKGGILADEMGLGKTMTTLALMMCRPKRHQLIIVPRVLLPQWVQVINERLKHKPLVLHGPNVHQYTIEQVAAAPFVITTYGMVTSRSRPSATHLLVREQKWGRVVIDEAHHLRNQGQSYLGVQALQTDHFWFLTGTPIQNRRGDLDCFWKLLGVPTTLFAVPGSEKRLIEHHILKRTKVSLRIGMTEPVVEIERSTWNDHDELNISDQFHSTLACFGRHRSDIRHGVRVFGANVLGALTRCRQSCVSANLYLHDLKKFEKRQPNPEDTPLAPEMQSGSKLQNIANHILNQHQAEAGTPNAGRKRLVFCHYLGAMAYLQQVLELQGLRVGQISGKTLPSVRLRYITHPVDVLLLQIRTGCEGLNLQAYSDVYFATPHWNPAVEEQAIGRVDRLGQQRHVRVFRFLMDATGEGGSSLDQYCEQTQQKKKLAAKIIRTKSR